MATMHIALVKISKDDLRFGCMIVDWNGDQWNLFPQQFATTPEQQRLAMTI